MIFFYSKPAGSYTRQSRHIPPYSGRLSPAEDDDQADVENLGLEHVRTGFFAWSAKWFAQPLLQKYPTALDLHVSPILSAGQSFC